ncbi:unnamed protein product [Euphydryas editha]|uniref:Interleukin-6 n=1 Tax=Euphydryas editha TaxID=104508 RepID=A0AAU9TL00_EUPED|nr:unnamed protein product [Euphydryas editha]
MDDLSFMFTSRMGEFEKNLPEAATTSSNLCCVKALTAEFYTFKNFVWKYLSLLKSQMEPVVIRLETYSRRKVPLLHGVKEETYKNVMKKTLAVLFDHMQLEGMNSESFETCHRLGTKKDTARPIVMRFSFVLIKCVNAKCDNGPHQSNSL